VILGNEQCRRFMKTHTHRSELASFFHWLLWTQTPQPWGNVTQYCIEGPWLVSYDLLRDLPRPHRITMLALDGGVVCNSWDVLTVVERFTALKCLVVRMSLDRTLRKEKPTTTTTLSTSSSSSAVGGNYDAYHILTGVLRKLTSTLESFIVDIPLVDELYVNESSTWASTMFCTVLEGCCSPRLRCFSVTPHPNLFNHREMVARSCMLTGTTSPTHLQPPPPLQAFEWTCTVMEPATVAMILQRFGNSLHTLTFWTEIYTDELLHVIVAQCPQLLRLTWIARNGRFSEHAWMEVIHHSAGDALLPLFPYVARR